MFAVAISPFLYISIKVTLIKINLYFYQKKVEQTENKLHEYSLKYTILEKEEKILGISFPKGTQFSRWRIQSNNVLFGEATFPKPYNFRGVYITGMGFEHRRLVTVNLFESQKIEGFMCMHSATLDLKSDGGIGLASCHLEKNPISKNVSLDDFHGIIRRKSTTLVNYVHTWELSGRGGVNGTEFYNYWFYLDENKSITEFGGYLLKLPKYTDTRSRGMLVETYDREEILKLKNNALLEDAS